MGRKYKLTIEELEDILSSYKISKPRYKNADVESKSLLTMLSTFRNLIKDEVPPTQEEFLSKFRENNPELRMQGIVSRLKRAYLSFVREYHLGYLLDKYFDDVLYDEEVDLAGIDYIITYKNVKFNIHAFVDTSSSRYWRSIKNKRHKFRGEHIDLPLNLSKGKRVGKFIMYTDSHIVALVNQMSKIVNTRPLTNYENPSDTN